MLSLTAVAIVAVTFGVLGVLVFRFVSPLVLSPLRQVPNAHWSSSFSSVWILWTRYRNRELAVLKEKHQQLGPIIRLGPADLSISCYENGVRTIYGGSFDKPGYYNFFYYDTMNAFCSLTRKDHSLRRKRITAAYTKSGIFASEPLSSLTQTILFDRLLPICQRQASSKRPVDILRLSYALSLDLLTSYQFGLASGSDFLQAPASLESWMRHYEQRYCKEAFWPQELPTLTRCLGSLGIDLLPASQRSSTLFLENWLLELCEQAESMRATAGEKGSLDARDIPVVYELVKTGVDADMPNASPEARRKEIASELFDQMSGGREVFGLVLAYTVYYISWKPLAQERLRAELSTLEPSMRQANNIISDHAEGDPIAAGSRLPPSASLDKLPFLSAIIKESLRMRPTSTPLPRITPRDRPVSLAGVDGIPPGTRVNTFQWLIHRNPDNHKQCDEWQPERWLEPKSEGEKDPLLWAFGSGSRVCVGVSLTQYLMRYILALIYSNFTSRVVSKKEGDFEPGSIEDGITIQFE